MILCATVDDACLEGYSSEHHLEGLLRFFDEVHIHATFFVEPRADGIPLQRRPGYIALLKQAVAEGHSLGQHGLDHDRFETGIPPKIVLDLPHEGPARERLARERQAIEANLQEGPIRERLTTGRRILEDALGLSISGFRAPCLSICDNLFRSLEAEDYRYDSSRHLQETGWDIINNKSSQPQPITREDFQRCQFPGRIRTLPLTTEYTWYLTRQKFEVTLDLARHDISACLRAGIPFVPVSHVSPIHECEHGCGFEIYRRMLAFSQEQAASYGQDLHLLNLEEACGRLFPSSN
jgi:peptidoglycan/xylan/chitin deacetylase (PgdA/CDA1 family)